MTPDRKNGRPRKGQGPRVPYEELDRILVFGEVVECEDGENATVYFPSYRTLALRYGVSHSLIAHYSKKHDCLRRRKEAKARIAAKADQKLVELRANAIAMSRDDAVRIIDSYLVNFEKALAEGRVRFDSPGDFNTMLRLKEFILGGADSRQEIHESLSLESIQERHQRMMRQVKATPAAVRGEVPRQETKSGRSGDRQPVRKPPPSASDATVQKLPVQPHNELNDEPPDTAQAPVRARVRITGAPAVVSAGRPENADTALTAPHVATSAPHPAIDALTEEHP